MTIRQKQLLVVSATLFLLMELFPPWSYEFPEASSIYPAGYHFRFSPPPLKSPEEMREIFPAAKPFKNREPLFRVRLDSLRLMAQRLVAIPLIIGLMILLKKSLSPVTWVVGGLFLCVGFIGLLFFIDMFIIEFGALKLLG